MLQSMKNMAKTNIPSDKKKINRQADHNHWPASIKSTCQWFTFHAIIEYTVNIMQDRAIPNYATVKEIKSLGATFNFIDIWLHLLHENYLTRSESYSITMKEMFKQIPQNVEKALNSREKKLKIDDRYWWWMVFEKM